MPDRIAIISYESPFAPGGGIAAVMKHLPIHLSRASNSEVIAITPFHRNIQKTLSLEPKMSIAGVLQVKYEDQLQDIQLLRFEQDGTWYFLKPRDPGFFLGVRHPYDVGSSEILTRDAVFFGSAAATAVTEIDASSNWILLLQDWEAAPTALAVASQASSPGMRIFLTMHNSYDSPAPVSVLQAAGIDPRVAAGDTILERTLQLVEKPVFTVSDQFAQDLTREILQTKVMAPHLQQVLDDRLIGIDNGPFTGLAFDRELLVQARKGEISSIKIWKDEQRNKARAALKALKPARQKPVWGNLRKFQFDDSPWFVLAGRDDPRQKGYDVACVAIDEFLRSGGEACFLFFPIPGDEGLPGLSFIKDLAGKYPHRVLGLPFLFQEGYLEVLRGSTYGMMPSLYEPFGMANEFYLNGCVGLGRATGGIIQQIIPYRAAACFSEAVKLRTDRLFGAAAPPTGFLYREQDGLLTAVEDWRIINQAGYQVAGHPNRVEERSTVPMFKAMSKELALCISDAASLYRHSEETYYQLLTNGIAYIQNSLSWEKAAQAYLRYIQ